jgi:phospholipid/cholesterol/gamma-HCH transport system permease protein
MAFVESRHEDGRHELVLKGRWCAANIAAIRTELAGLDTAHIRTLQISAGEAALDLAGAWQLEQFLHGLPAGAITVEFAPAAPQALEVVRAALAVDASVRPAALHHDEFANPVELLGRRTLAEWHELRAGLAFGGRTVLTWLSAFGSWHRWRPISIARHVYDTGITAIPIVALIAFLISVIIAYLSASQLRNYGADIYVVDLITIGVLRELGVLLTAIIVAGRTGSAFAAELGSMQLNEEVDALNATGVNPIETLVLPRIFGLVIALPLLTVIADVIGMAGGALLCQWLLDMPLQQFINRANEAIAPTTFWVGIIKAPVFALLIAVAGTYRGLKVRGSSRELGRQTTVAVVQAIFLVLLADALFAMLFMELDI